MRTVFAVKYYKDEGFVERKMVKMGCIRLFYRGLCPLGI